MGESDRSRAASAGWPRPFAFLARCFAKAVLIVAIGTYVFLCPRILVAHSGSQLLLMPRPPGEEYRYCDRLGFKCYDAKFRNSAGDLLHGWWFENPHARTTVLFCHGNAGNIGHRLLHAKALLDGGASVFLFDYRGYGKSEGVADLSGLVDDADCAYRLLTSKHGVSPTEIILYGESIGGGVASAICKHRGSRGLILDSTFASMLSVARKKIPYFYLYPDFLGPEPSFDTRTVLGGISVPLLILHGKRDTVIPESEARANYAAASNPKRLVILPNSDHNNKSADSKQFAAELGAFIESVALPTAHSGN